MAVTSVCVGCFLFFPETEGSYLAETKEVEKPPPFTSGIVPPEHFFPTLEAGLERAKGAKTRHGHNKKPDR